MKIVEGMLLSDESIGWLIVDYVFFGSHGFKPQTSVLIFQLGSRQNVIVTIPINARVKSLDNQEFRDSVNDTWI